MARTAIFTSRTSKTEYRARKIVLATGYYDVPNMLNVPGEELDKVIHYYKEPHPYYNHDVLVVGAKNSAAIAALELFWTGARVTMIHRGAGISDRVKYWIKPNIENRIKSGEVKAYFHSHLIAIHPKSVEIQTPEGPKKLANDFVFAMTGYRPDLGISRVPGHPPGPRIAEAAHQSGNFRKRPAGNFPGRRHRGRDAHQRNLHRKRPLPRQANRRRHRRFPCAFVIDIIDVMNPTRFCHSLRNAAGLVAFRRSPPLIRSSAVS